MPLIADSAQLAAFCARISQADFITVDTEFMRERTYWPQLCLVQVAGPGEVAAIHFTINGVYKGETRIQLEHVNRVGSDAAPDWPRGSQDDVYRVVIEGSPSITQETAFRFTDGSRRDAATAGCMATGLRALNAVPYVNDLPPGWVTALDLPLIPGVGTIR